MKTIKLFVAAAIVALAASCSSKPAETSEVAADTTAVAPAEVAPADTATVAADTTAAQ